MVPGLQVTQQRGGDGGHAARRAARGGSTLERAHARLEHRDGRVGVAAIDIARLVALEPRLGLLGGLIDIARVEEDGLGGLAELTAQRPLMHEPRCRAPGARAALIVFTCPHGRHSFRLEPRPGHKKARTLALSQKTGIGKTASHGLLATCLTWLQAGRPNHHEAHSSRFRAPPVKPSRSVSAIGLL